MNFGARQLGLCAGFLLSVLVAGCALPMHRAAPDDTYARVSPGKLDDGTDSVILYRTRRIGSLATRVRNDDSSGVTNVFLNEGTYVANVNCRRTLGGATGPDALEWVVIDSAFEFTFSVEAGRNYRVDCAPTSADVGFFVTPDGR